MDLPKWRGIVHGQNYLINLPYPLQGILEIHSIYFETWKGIAALPKPKSKAILCLGHSVNTIG